MQFERLERIEVGGNKGRTLSASVYQVHADFSKMLETFRALPYDVRMPLSPPQAVAAAAPASANRSAPSGWLACLPRAPFTIFLALPSSRSSPLQVLDVEHKAFDSAFFTFRSSVKELERRLGSVLNQGFDDCATIFDAFKLIESFEGLLEREFIQVHARHLALPTILHACVLACLTLLCPVIPIKPARALDLLEVLVPCFTALRPCTLPASSRRTWSGSTSS